MSPTRIRILLAMAAIAAALGWGALTLVEGQSGRVIPVPWLSAATMWVLAVALLIWATLSRPRLQRLPGARPMPPLVAARTAALAMAASRVGALVGGFYLGVAIGAVARRTSEAGNDTMLAGAGAALGSLALVIVALWLEKLCRLPLDDDKDPRGGKLAPKPRTEPGGMGARIGSEP
jgi:hypothetical protein